MIIRNPGTELRANPFQLLNLSASAARDIMVRNAVYRR